MTSSSALNSAWFQQHYCNSPVQVVSGFKQKPFIICILAEENHVTPFVEPLQSINIYVLFFVLFFFFICGNVLQALASQPHTELCKLLVSSHAQQSCNKCWHLAQGEHVIILCAHSAGMKTHVDYLALHTVTANPNCLAESQQGNIPLRQSISAFPFSQE